MIKSTVRMVIGLANLGILFFIATIAIVEAEELNASELPILFLILLLFLLNAYFLLLGSVSQNEGSWLTMFLKRKTLEEKKKIEKLEKAS